MQNVKATPAGTLADSYTTGESMKEKNMTPEQILEFVKRNKIQIVDLKF